MMAESWRQEERQRTRVAGRYARHNPCEVCGRGTGTGFYSDARTCDAEGVGQILCRRDCARGEALPVAEALKLYRGQMGADQCVGCERMFDAKKSDRTPLCWRCKAAEDK